MTFRPRKIPTVSLEAPLERRWEVMGEEEAARLHAQRQEEAVRFSWRAPRTKKRALRCFVLTPIGFMVLGWLFVGGNLRTAAVFFGVGFPLGGLTFFLRPTDYLSGLLYAICGVAATAIASRAHPITLLMVAMLCGSIGIAMGRAELDRRMDLED